MKSPFISIIIPTLNEEKYIEHCLKSILNQNYRGKFEIIVADAMSKDNTRKIAKKYADKVLLVKKKGVSAGRNEGAKTAKGKILLFIDADTILPFNALEELSKPFKNKNVVGTTCAILPLSGRNVDIFLISAFNQLVKVSIKANKPQVAGICCAYRKTAFEKVDGFNEKLVFSEDLDLSKRIAKLGKIKFVDKTVVLTSVRRFEVWGRKEAVKKYLSYWLKYVLAKKPISIMKYRPIRR